MAPIPPLITQCAGPYIPTWQARLCPQELHVQFQRHEILLPDAAVRDAKNRIEQGQSLGVHLEEETDSNRQECNSKVTAVQE